MQENSDREFLVQAAINGMKQELWIVPSETTDGVAFYKCRLGDQEIAQLRKDDGEWKQVWGEISTSDIQAIGMAIEAVVPAE